MLYNKLQNMKYCKKNVFDNFCIFISRTERKLHLYCPLSKFRCQHFKPHTFLHYEKGKLCLKRLQIVKQYKPPVI